MFCDEQIVTNCVYYSLINFKCDRTKFSRLEHHGDASVCPPPIACELNTVRTVRGVLGMAIY